jgi:nucleotide-binding universal stress UspA family protein
MNSEIPLVRSVLHPTDFSDASHRAFAHALAISLLRQTELTILHVCDEKADDVDWASFPQVRSTLEKWKLLEAGSQRSEVFQELGIAVRKLALRDSNPGRATISFLDQQEHDLVVLATSGLAQGKQSWLRRSEAEAIARGSRAMTLFVPAQATRDLVSLEDGDLNLQNVIVAIDAAIDFSGAIEFARRAAEILGDGDAEITLLHVGEQMPQLPSLPEGSRWSWRTALREGEPVESILAAADELAADLVVMTTNGRDTLNQALSGSTTERVLRSAKCPVLAVPDGEYATTT